MRVILPPECDNAWIRSLSRWQLAELASIFRQGKHLHDGTDHGGDMRWRQAGVKLYDWQSGWTRNPRSSSHHHERIVIRPRAYGYDAIGIRRYSAYVVDPETGAMSEAPEAWVPVWVWHIQADCSSSYDPEEVDRARARQGD